MSESNTLDTRTLNDSTSVQCVATMGELVAESSFVTIKVIGKIHYMNKVSFVQLRWCDSTSTKNSLELIELSSINKVSLV